MWPQGQITKESDDKLPSMGICRTAFYHIRLSIHKAFLILIGYGNIQNKKCINDRFQIFTRIVLPACDDML